MHCKLVTLETARATENLKCLSEVSLLETPLPPSHARASLSVHALPVVWRHRAGRVRPLGGMVVVEAGGALRVLGA